ncbi:unnamed protein product [Brugia timori]|uniref:Uncharacterized protein n=1 Tax=Brugia timori TaxID=42155 RepID=A0A0R3R1V5_9BILA|nr:unnamed protein product [Brugia timori]
MSTSQQAEMQIEKFQKLKENTFALFIRFFFSYFFIFIYSINISKCFDK